MRPNNEPRFQVGLNQLPKVSYGYKNPTLNKLNKKIPQKNFSFYGRYDRTTSLIQKLIPWNRYSMGRFRVVFITMTIVTTEHYGGELICKTRTLLCVEGYMRLSKQNLDKYETNILLREKFFKIILRLVKIFG